MPHLQNCATILNPRVPRMVRGGCGWCGRSKIKKMSWEKGTWYSGGGEKHCQCLGNPSIAWCRQCSALNCATNPNYPDTEPRMIRIKTRTRPSVSGSTAAKTHFSNQHKQVNPLSQKNSIDPNRSLRRLTPSCNWDYSCGSLWRPIQLPIQD